MTGIITDLLQITNDILGVRDSIGAVIHSVYFVTRTWTGSEPGSGTATDVTTLMVPSPALVDLSHRYTVQEPGRYKKGDMLLKYVSKQAYPSEDTVRLKSSASNIEKFFKINNQLYVVQDVAEKYVYWDVHIRRILQ